MVMQMSRKADVDKRHERDPAQCGYWIKENIRANTYLRMCSICGKIAYFCGKGCSYKYCPYCGQPMEVDKDAQIH